MSAVCLHLWYHCQLFVYTGTNVRIWYINVTKARFARNVVKWDNFANSQTPWNVLIFTLRHKDKSQVKWIIRLQTTFLPFLSLGRNQRRNLEDMNEIRQMLQSSVKQLFPKFNDFGVFSLQLERRVKIKEVCHQLKKNESHSVWKSPKMSHFTTLRAKRAMFKLRTKVS